MAAKPSVLREATCRKRFHPATDFMFGFIRNNPVRSRQRRLYAHREIRFDNDSNTKTVAIGKNGKVSLSWSLIAPTITESGVTQLTVTAEYKNNEGTGITKSFYIALNKYAEGSADPKQPKATVEINSFTAPQSVKAGEVFETTLTLTNTSEVDASKVTVTAQLTETLNSLNHPASVAQAR